MVSMTIRIRVGTDSKQALVLTPKFYLYFSCLLILLLKFFGLSYISTAASFSSLNIALATFNSF